MTALSVEPSEELPWMQGPTEMERDVKKDKAVGLKDELKILILS